MSEGWKEAIRADDEVIVQVNVAALRKQIYELLRVLGKQALENGVRDQPAVMTHPRYGLGSRSALGYLIA